MVASVLRTSPDPPGETKQFSQFWYPIQKIGPLQEANRDAAVSLNVYEGAQRARMRAARQANELAGSSGGALDTATVLRDSSKVGRIGIYATKVIRNPRTELWHGERFVKDWNAAVAPNAPFMAEAAIQAGPVAVRMLDAEGD